MPSNGTSSNGIDSKSRDVFIVSATRTPIGSMGGSLAQLKATDLVSIAIKSAYKNINLSPEFVEKVFIGQAVGAGSGQAAAKQAVVAAGLPVTCRDRLINEVCASGMQAIIDCADKIKLGANVLVAAGMESMSNAPYYQSRNSPTFGGFKVEDALLIDGLSDTFSKCHMGDLAEYTAKKHQITREDQDKYAIESYKRARDASESGLLAKEICSVEIPSRKNKPSIVVSEDEEFKKIDINKVPTLNPCFDRTSGTITAANASSLSDGAAACILMSGDALAKHDVKPMAKVVAYGDDGCDPRDFATSPIEAVRNALKKANLSQDDIASWEVNEAFSVVALAFMKELELDHSKVNVYGGGVSLGHPLGMSGTRIVNSLAHQLKPGDYGCAAICRGGGGASAVIIQKL